MKPTQTLLSAAILLTLATSANASLTASADGKTVWDADLGITWLADANYAQTSGYSVDGLMTWNQAQGWIASLNTANYLGYSDWRLPTTTDTGTSGCNYSNNGTDCGFNSTGSEMSHLFYTELGNKGYSNTSGAAQSGFGLVNKGPFTNFQSYLYWSGTEYAPDPLSAWAFNTLYGNQGVSGKANSLYALAVRPGQVAAVPEPDTLAMLLAGLGLVGAAARRRRG
jgi:hypothetical protein